METPLSEALRRVVTLFAQTDRSWQQDDKKSGGESGIRIQLIT